MLENVFQLFGLRVGVDWPSVREVDMLPSYC